MGRALPWHNWSRTKKKATRKRQQQVTRPITTCLGRHPIQARSEQGPHPVVFCATMHIPSSSVGRHFCVIVVRLYAVTALTCPHCACKLYSVLSLCPGSALPLWSTRLLPLSSSPCYTLLATRSWLPRQYVWPCLPYSSQVCTWSQTRRRHTASQAVTTSATSQSQPALAFNSPRPHNSELYSHPGRCIAEEISLFHDS